MSRCGNALDNAPMESFFHTLGTELVHHRSDAIHDEARRDLFAYVEGFRNRHRLHSALGFRTPAEAEQKAGSAMKSAESVAYDLMIVTLLAHQAEALLPALRRSAPKCVQFMFNTFHPERLQEAVGDERCAFGMPFVQATLDGDGRLRATIGAAGQRTIMNRQCWVDVFNAAGLPAALEPDMASWLRCHVPLCVAFESVSVAGERRGGGATWKEALVLARGVHESFKLIEELGHRIYPKAKKRIRSSPTWVVAAMLWVMSRIRSFRELLAAGQAECCALVDAMATAAPLARSSGTVTGIQAMRPS